MATSAKPPVPSLLALRAVVNALNQAGLRLKSSIVIDSGDVRTTHHFACAIGFGATAVCPYLAWAIAKHHSNRLVNGMSVGERGHHFRTAMENGLLKIMSKVGISSVRSYRSSKLFTPLGLSHELVHTYFPGLSSAIGGLGLDDFAERILKWTEDTSGRDVNDLPMVYRFKEHSRGLSGEKHDMTAARSRRVHQLVQAEDPASRQEQYAEYLELGYTSEPTRLSHLLSVRRATESLALDQVEPVGAITRRFGSGAMSFGGVERRITARYFQGDGHRGRPFK